MFFLSIVACITFHYIENTYYLYMYLYNLQSYQGLHILAFHTVIDMVVVLHSTNVVQILYIIHISVDNRLHICL